MSETESSSDSGAGRPVQHHPLECGVGRRPGRFDAGDGGAGKTGTGLLVSSLQLRSPAWNERGRGAESGQTVESDTQLKLAYLVFSNTNIQSP